MYHTATLQLLGHALHYSETSATEVREAERRLGVRLPASVREWYSYESATSVLFDHSNQNPPIDVGEFAAITWQERRLLPFQNENHGVCTWALDLDGSEDPPVLVDVHSGGRDWRPCASTFSSYVYTCVWDYRHVVNCPIVLRAQNSSTLSPAAHAALSANFSEGQRTQAWPGDSNYRFEGHGAAILIWSRADYGADWLIAGSNIAKLKRVVRMVWSLDEVGRALWASDVGGQAVLRAVR